MQPQQSYTPPTNPGAYDFIVNPGTAPSRSFGTGSSKMKRIIIVLGGVFALLILFVIVKNLLTSDANNVPAMTKVVSQQQELIRLTSTANRGNTAINDSTRSVAITTQLSIESDRAALIKYLSTRNVKLTKKKTFFAGAAAIDKQLAAATAAGTYDSSLRQVLKTQLVEYRAALKQAYKKTTGTKGRELLNREYNHSELLLRQLNSAS